ncbi:MAG: hypothetical protein M1840_004719 [Geoglossum simile]|nr:MAG: hypothetical protein M1840_004719 [Geoglossum simile]
MPSRTSIFASVFTFIALPSLVLSGGPIKFFPRQSVDSGLGVNPSAKGATASVTPNSGPNGGEGWLNSGIKGDGWTAPFLHWDSLVKVNRATFYSKIGANCAKYDWAFQASGNKHDIDPVYLAMIAMQESSCNADAGK